MEREAETTQESLQPEQQVVSPSAGEASSPTEPGERTFSGAEVAKIQSSYGKQVEKLSRELERIRTEHQQLRDSAAQREKEEYDKLLEDAGGDPKLQAMLKKEQSIKAKEMELRQKEAEIASREEEHKELLETASEVRRREIANKLAAEHGVSVDVLLEFGDKTPEVMETTAKRLAKAMGAKKPEADGKPPMRPYSGAGQGAGIDLSGKKPLELATMAYNQPKKK